MSVAMEARSDSSPEAKAADEHLALVETGLSSSITTESVGKSTPRGLEEPETGTRASLCFQCYSAKVSAAKSLIKLIPASNS
jgi:hypothetical protein